MLKRQLTASVGMMALAVAVPVSAQEVAEQASGGATESVASPNNDIIVTAQRRSESLSKVPVSVSALTAEMLQERNVSSEQDLAAVVPGLIVKSGQNSNQISFTLRGQTLDPFSGSSPA